MRCFSPAPAASPAEGGTGDDSDHAQCQASSARAASAALFGHPGYFLFIGGSSTNAPQNPVGFTFVAFLITLTFIVLSLSNAGRVMRQRDDRRFETPLVTCRQVHVAKL